MFSIYTLSGFATTTFRPRKVSLERSLSQTMKFFRHLYTFVAAYTSQLGNIQLSSFSDINWKGFQILRSLLFCQYKAFFVLGFVRELFGNAYRDWKCSVKYKAPDLYAVSNLYTIRKSIYLVKFP